MPDMRILHVCADGGIPADGTKGASVHFRSLHAALRQQGVDVTAVMVRLPKSPVPEVPHVVPYHQLSDLLAIGGPTIVLERYALGHDATLWACRALNIPHILEVNAPLVDEATLHRPTTVRSIDREIEHRLWSLSDLVLCVSSPLAKLVAEFRTGPIDVVRNGFDPSLVSGPPPTMRVDPTLAFLGHPKPWHGTSALPKILRHASLERMGARLLIIGGGEGAESLRTAARGTPLESRIEITGPLPQNAALDALRTAHVAIAPYPRETNFYFCPLKAIEAMGAGVPVVSVDQGDLCEIIGDGGILVPPGDNSAMAEACARLLSDTELRTTMGAAGRRRALASLTWHHAAAAVVAHSRALLVRMNP